MDDIKKIIQYFYKNGYISTSLPNYSKFCKRLDSIEYNNGSGFKNVIYIDLLEVKIEDPNFNKNIPADWCDITFYIMEIIRYLDCKNQYYFFKYHFLENRYDFVYTNRGILHTLNKNSGIDGDDAVFGIIEIMDKKIIIKNI